MTSTIKKSFILENLLSFNFIHFAKFSKSSFICSLNIMNLRPIFLLVSRSVKRVQITSYSVQWDTSICCVNGFFRYQNFAEARWKDKRTWTNGMTQVESFVVHATILKAKTNSQWMCHQVDIDLTDK